MPQIPIPDDSFVNVDTGAGIFVQGLIVGLVAAIGLLALAARHRRPAPNWAVGFVATSAVAGGLVASVVYLAGAANDGYPTPNLLPTILFVAPALIVATDARFRMPTQSGRVALGTTAFAFVGVGQAVVAADVFWCIDDGCSDMSKAIVPLRFLGPWIAALVLAVGLRRGRERRVDRAERAGLVASAALGGALALALFPVMATAGYSLDPRPSLPTRVDLGRCGVPIVDALSANPTADTPPGHPVTSRGVLECRRAGERLVVAGLVLAVAGLAIASRATLPRTPREDEESEATADL